MRLMISAKTPFELYAADLWVRNLHLSLAQATALADWFWDQEPATLHRQYAELAAGGRLCASVVNALYIDDVLPVDTRRYTKQDLHAYFSTRVPTRQVASPMLQSEPSGTRVCSPLMPTKTKIHRIGCAIAHKHRQDS